MATYQRRRGIEAKVWKVALKEDNRGNVVQRAEDVEPHRQKVWVYPQRSSRAEVPGQQEINVIRIGVDANLPDVTLWSKVELLGQTWDVVTPPSYHHGTRHTRHWSIDLRARPDADA